MDFCAVPDLITIVAVRSSVVSLAVVVMVIFDAPALPLVGDTLHHASARLFIASAVHASEEVNITIVDPPSVAKFAAVASRVISGTLGFSLFEFPPPSSIPLSEQATNATITNKT